MPTYPYDASFNPAAPMLPVQMSRPFGPAIVTARAMIDSGSDITTVPTALAYQLGLPRVFPPIEVREVIGDSLKKVPAFSASIAQVMGQFTTVVVILWDAPYVLLGRDFINSLKITLDGPQGVVEVSA